MMGECAMMAVKKDSLCYNNMPKTSPQLSRIFEDKVFCTVGCQKKFFNIQIWMLLSPGLMTESMSEPTQILLRHSSSNDFRLVWLTQVTEDEERVVFLGITCREGGWWGCSLNRTSAQRTCVTWYDTTFLRYVSIGIPPESIPVHT
jgi:hypothetical protein